MKAAGDHGGRAIFLSSMTCAVKDACGRSQMGVMRVVRLL
jgi:hypothetical protein